MRAKEMKYVLSLVVCILSSCSLFPEPTGLPDRFILEALPFDGARGSLKKSPSKPAIFVDQPVIYAPLDTTRIALKPTPHTIDYIADIEWGDRLGTLIHESVIQSFQNAQAFSSVSRLNSGLKGKYMIALDVRKFQKKCCDNTAEVEYFVQVFDINEHNATTSQLFNITLPLQGNTAKAVALTLNEAHKKALSEILQWLKKVLV